MIPKTLLLIMLMMPSVLLSSGVENASIKIKDNSIGYDYLDNPFVIKSLDGEWYACYRWDIFLSVDNSLVELDERRQQIKEYEIIITNFNSYIIDNAELVKVLERKNKLKFLKGLGVGFGVGSSIFGTIFIIYLLKSNIKR